MAKIYYIYASRITNRNDITKFHYFYFIKHKTFIFIYILKSSSSINQIIGKVAEEIIANFQQNEFSSFATGHLEISSPIQRREIIKFNWAMESSVQLLARDIISHLDPIFTY